MSESTFTFRTNRYDEHDLEAITEQEAIQELKKMYKKPGKTVLLKGILREWEKIETNPENYYDQDIELKIIP